MTARGEGCERSDTGPEDRRGEPTCQEIARGTQRRAAYKRLSHAVGARADQQDASNAPLQPKRNAADRGRTVLPHSEGAKKLQSTVGSHG